MTKFMFALPRIVTASRTGLSDGSVRATFANDTRSPFGSAE